MCLVNIATKVQWLDNIINAFIVIWVKSCRNNISEISMRESLIKIRMAECYTKFATYLTCGSGVGELHKALMLNVKIKLRQILPWKSSCKLPLKLIQRLSNGLSLVKWEGPLQRPEFDNQQSSITLIWNSLSLLPTQLPSQFHCE